MYTCHVFSQGYADFCTKAKKNFRMGIGTHVTPVSTSSFKIHWLKEAFLPSLKHIFLELSNYYKKGSICLMYAPLPALKYIFGFRFNVSVPQQCQDRSMEIGPHIIKLFVHSFLIFSPLTETFQGLKRSLSYSVLFAFFNWRSSESLFLMRNIIMFVFSFLFTDFYFPWYIN